MIALTGFAAAGMREKCLAAGFDEHMVKPGDINKLAHLLGDERPSAGNAPV
jgi:CheY-like chemotaxis protein